MFLQSSDRLCADTRPSQQWHHIKTAWKELKSHRSSSNKTSSSIWPGTWEMFAETQDHSCSSSNGFMGFSPWGLHSPACPALCNGAISPAVGQVWRPLAEGCSRWKLRAACARGWWILLPLKVAHTFQHTWAASVTEAMEECPARSPKASPALERGCCEHLCDTASWIVSGELQDAEGTWCRHLTSISNPGTFFPRKPPEYLVSLLHCSLRLQLS